MRVLVTGSAGFIGYHSCIRLLQDGHTVIGIDNFNDYYSQQLKHDRTAEIRKHPNSSNFRLEEIDLRHKEQLLQLFQEFKPDYVLNFAAQAGVRFSVKDPQTYLETNLSGFLNLLECCRAVPVKHLVFASSSSVYGLSENLPWSETDSADRPTSFYAATKRSNELMAHSYAHLFHIPCTGLRFFTVYGPWGRPDMAYFHFTKAIEKGEPIQLFNFGNMERDFTYVNDITSAVSKIIPMAPNSDEQYYAIYNIGNNRPVSLGFFVQTLETILGKKAKVVLNEMQAGEVVRTFANIDALAKKIGYQPQFELKQGLQEFVNWYRSYYK